MLPAETDMDDSLFNVQRVTSLRQPAAPSPEDRLPPFDLEKAEAHWARGEIRPTVDLLLRFDLREELPLAIRSRATLLLAEAYGRLGLRTDANEWLITAQALTKKIGDASAQSSFDATHAALLHWMGEEVKAIRAANAALGRHSRRATDPFRQRLLEVLGSAYLRLGQIVKAEQCAQAMLKAASSSAGFALLGETKLWSIVRQHPTFRGQLLLSDELGVRPAPPGELVAAATDAYARAFETSREATLYRRNAHVGLIKARLAGRPRSADWAELETYIAWCQGRGLRYERDLHRLHLGVLLLLHKRPLDARRWLMPMADNAMTADGALLEHDALYFASVACAESGFDRAALTYLNCYNIRIREQHLARATVPPPNLEQQQEAPPARSLKRRRGESDREIVEQVVEHLRCTPESRLDSYQLAKLAGVSRRTLENGFRRVTGLAPHEFATRLRLAEFERRKTQLDEPDHATLEDLARSVGFSSLRALSRSAKRVRPSNEGTGFLDYALA